MTDDEESLMWLGVRLREMLEDMIAGKRLTEADIPDDFKALTAVIAEHNALTAKVEDADD